MFKAYTVLLSICSYIIVDPHGLASAFNIKQDTVIIRVLWHLQMIKLSCMQPKGVIENDQLTHAD